MYNFAVYKGIVYLCKVYKTKIKIVSDKIIDDFRCISILDRFTLELGLDEVEEIYSISFNVEVGGEFHRVYYASSEDFTIYIATTYEDIDTNPVFSLCESKPFGFPNEKMVNVPKEYITNVSFIKSFEDPESCTIDFLFEIYNLINKNNKTLVHPSYGN